MKTIRGKLLVYFFIFAFLFQVVAISIFVSSKEITTTYDQSFQRFLLLNTISQITEELSLQTKAIVIDPESEDSNEYFTTKRELQSKKNELLQLFNEDDYKIKNYHNLIDTFIHESEMTVGFVFKDDIEQYTNHLEETQIAAGYIQEYALELIDIELTAYQSFYKDMQLRNEYFFMFIVFLFITTIALAIFFAIWFSTGITKPVNKLASAATEVAEGNLLGKPVEIHSNDELQLLSNTFNDMRSNIHRLVQEIKDQSELDSLLKEMELKHLQNQINPHFLFNTLNTISKMAYLEDAHSTSNLIDSVATLLRHNLGEINSSVTLKEEVDVVKDYFLIQKNRFSDRVNFVYRIDESCLHIEVPRLTLQPLVENAFIHGIEEKEEGGTISLHIEQTNKYIIVDVIDDGLGMERERLERLKLFNQEKVDHVGHSTGIGLTNVIRRLQLFYNENHVAEIESEKGRGTKIRLLLPKNNM